MRPGKATRSAEAMDEDKVDRMVLFGLAQNMKSQWFVSTVS